MRAHALRDVFDAIFYVLRSGCPWRMLPGDFPPWSTVYYHFRRFRLSGLWHRAFAMLRAAERKRVGKYPGASTAILDSQRVRYAYPSTIGRFTRESPRLERREEWSR
jgi:putative transposase